MKGNRSILVTSILSTFVVMGIVGQASVALADPQITYQTELQAHPAMAHAIHDMQESLIEMEKTPDNFGGFKPTAIHDVKVAIHTLKKALYYRLKLDDAAVDNAP